MAKARIEGPPTERAKGLLLALAYRQDTREARLAPGEGE
jgi:hypothetical protein